MAGDMVTAMVMAGMVTGMDMEVTATDMALVTERRKRTLTTITLMTMSKCMSN